MKLYIEATNGDMTPYQDVLDYFYVNRERIVTNKGRFTVFSINIENVQQIWELKEKVGDFVITENTLGEPLILILKQAWR